MTEYLSNNVWLVWIFVSIICLIIELGSGDLFLLCFAIGALGGSVAAAIGWGIIPQLIVMAIVTTLSIFFVRPVALRYLHRNDDNRVSNADALIGRTGTVSQTIDAGGYGRVAIDGDDWKAVSEDGRTIERGSKVEVVDRESIILTVRKVYH
ncbi:MAG: NfeD family protein [Prevotella sp.]|nr:NfeD family protein [Prevotella sp.]